jgi:hypothetical protein
MTDALTATVPAELVAASTERRTITGRIVPWDVTGRTSIGPARFSAGSLVVPDPLHRLKLLAGHREPGQPDPAAVGFATACADTGAGLEVVFSVPTGDAGDAALHSAANHLADGLSVEVSGIVGLRADDGALVVTSASLDAVAQVAVPAFAPAQVLSVNASAGVAPMTTEQGATTVDTITTDDATTVATDTDTDAAATAGAPSSDLNASRPTMAAGIPAVPRQAQSLTLARVAGMIAAANRGEMQASDLRAALALSDTTKLAGITPNAYVAELAGLVNMGRPTAGAIRNRQLPDTGMNVTWPSWKVLPSVATQATQGSQPSSTAAEIELKTTPVVTEAGANELSVQAVDRTDPGAIEALLLALGEVYGRKVNAATSAALIAAAGTPVGLQGLSFVDAVAALLGEFSPTGTPAGGLFVSVAWDVYCSELVTMTEADKPAWWDGSVSMGGPNDATASVSGSVNVVVDASLPAGDVLMGASQGASLWENQGAPAQIRVVDVGALAVDVAVYGYHAVSVEYPGAVALGSYSTAPASRSAKK